MKLIKVQKEDCPACKQVEAFLQNQDVAYDTVDVYQDPSIAMELGVMTVPVTVVKDDDGSIVASSLGFKPGELAELVEMVK
jgi:thioredoxin 1